MRLSAYLPIVLAFVAAGLAAVAAAVFSVALIERASMEQVSHRLQIEDQTWVQVEVDGLQVSLSGTAPDEATRFRALSIAGSVVDDARVIDRMQVDPGKPITPPRFSIEILRNDDGISLIGLVPGAMDREAVTRTIAQLAQDSRVTDLLESADYPVPGGWAPALSFALDALAQLPRSKISVASDKVVITAISDSGAQKRQLESVLKRAKPDGITLELSISAPRPVITPFTLRFLIDADGGRFDACTAHTEEGRARILAAAAEAGLQGRTECALALGVPSPRWPDAVTLAIGAIKDLGGGTVTFSDADISLVGVDTMDQAEFDRVVGRLEKSLPEVFSLTAVLPEPVKIDGTGEGEGPPEFVATLSPEGLLQLRGRISDQRLRTAVEGFARARFGGMELTSTLRLDDTLANDWPTRVLTGVEALSLLSNGVLVVQPDFVDLRGKTGNPEAKAVISRILSDQLGTAENFSLAVEYVEALDPVANLPTPAECVESINTILTARKLTFEPGSGELDGNAGITIDKIAEIMERCDFVPMEIAGHTDSQGRETMNLQLSQQRAEAVLRALLARRVITTNLSAKGYGEEVPVADNGTEEGREANRRIEFTLIEDDAATAGSGDETTEEPHEQDHDAEAAPDEPVPDEDTPPQDEDEGSGDALPSETGTENE